MLSSNRKLWKAIATCLSAILLVAVTACGAAQNSGSPAASNPAPGSPAASKPAESAKASAPAKPQEPLKIGAILTSSGPIGSIGPKQLLGAELAVDEINAAGGILGRKIELIVRDDGGDPTKALTAAHELVEKQGVTIIIGVTLGSASQAVQPYLTEQKVVLIGMGSSGFNDPQKYPYSFFAAALPSLQTEILVQYAVEVTKAQKIGVIAESTAFGNMSIDDIKKHLNARGGLQPAGIELYASGTQDVTAQLTNLRKAGTQVVIGVTQGADSVRVLKTLQGMGWEVPFLGNEGLADATIIDGVGPDGLKLAYAYGFARQSYSDKTTVHPRTKEFADKLAKRLNQNPLRESLQHPPRHYDIVYMLKMAIEKAQSTEGPKVAAGLEEIKNFDGARASFTFSKDNHVGMSLDQLTMVKVAQPKDGFFERAPGY
ncbi:MAG: hypothetical protein EPO21_00115 [Chloroflexota bacterium]|nr:MAG: hypothetical protein EPO21_00115 [Chloroflexota bacterium]